MAGTPEVFRQDWRPFVCLAAGFINKEQWLMLASDGSEWIETGMLR
ncbi:MAG: hypothetical protein JWN15_3897 [Firmicutes bacterium]|jgi:hypothetical protein|nr:hypothetical protein [Bacillota bacterium]